MSIPDALKTASEPLLLTRRRIWIIFGALIAGMLLSSLDQTIGIFGLAAVAGPLLGGFFVDHLTWQWAFYINIPVGVIAFVITWFALTLPNKRPTHRIDILGVVFLSAATVCLIFFTEFGGNDKHGWGAPETLMWGAGLLIAACLFVFVESRAEDPIIPLSFFTNSVFVIATAIGFVLGIVMFAALAFIPTFLQMASGASAAASGCCCCP